MTQGNKVTLGLLDASLDERVDWAVRSLQQKAGGTVRVNGVAYWHLDHTGALPELLLALSGGELTLPRCKALSHELRKRGLKVSGYEGGRPYIRIKMKESAAATAPSVPDGDSKDDGTINGTDYLFGRFHEDADTATAHAALLTALATLENGGFTLDDFSVFAAVHAALSQRFAEPQLSAAIRLLTQRTAEVKSIVDPS